MGGPYFPADMSQAEIRQKLYASVAPRAEEVVANARFAVGDGRNTTLDYNGADKSVTELPDGSHANSKQNGGDAPAGLGGVNGTGVRTAPSVFITSTTASSEVAPFPLLTVGPVIGLTTDTTTRVLIECNTTMTVQMRLRMVERNVRLTRGNQRLHDQTKANSMLNHSADNDQLRQDAPPAKEHKPHQPHPSAHSHPDASHSNGHAADPVDPMFKNAVTTSSLAQVEAQSSSTGSSPSSSSHTAQSPSDGADGSKGSTIGKGTATGETSTEVRPAPATEPAPSEHHQQIERDLTPAENAADDGSYAPSALSSVQDGSRATPFEKSAAMPDGTLRHGSAGSPTHLSESVEDGHVIEKDIDCNAHRVSCCTFTDLEPDCRYEITFPNLKTRVPSTVTTMLKGWKVSSLMPMNIALVSCNLLSVTKDLAVPESDLWLDLRRRVAEHEVDYVCHIGDQIYADEKRDIEADDKDYQLVFKTGVSMLKPLPVSDWPAAAVHIKELYRQLYRETWQHPPTAFVLANAPSLMIYDDHDFRDDWGNEPEDSDPTSVEYYVGRCAHEVMCEYQRQLWDNVDFTRLNEIRKDFHFHANGEHGIVFLDVRGPRSLHRIEDEPYPYIGSLQWKELKAALADDGIMKDVKSLLIICPAPIVFLPTSINDFLGRTVIDDALGHWSSKPFKAEQQFLLNLCQAWKAGGEEREVTFIGGDVHVGGHSEITRDGVVMFQQFVTSAISNYRLSKFEFFMGQVSQDLITTLEDGWGFKHRGFTRQRNYGLIQIGRDGVGPYVQRRLVTPKGEKPAADNRRGTAHLK